VRFALTLVAVSVLKLPGYEEETLPVFRLRSQVHPIDLVVGVAGCGTHLFRDPLYRLSAPAPGSHPCCKIAPRPGVSRANSISLIRQVRSETSLGIGNQVAHGASLACKLFAHALASLVLVV
jgi:hypothetical protein